MSSPEFIERKNPEIKEKEYIKTVSIVLNPQDNGGESVILEVDFFHNGDPKNSIYTIVHIKSECYGIHSVRHSFGSVNLDSFQKAFTHMQEVAKILGGMMPCKQDQEKCGNPNSISECAKELEFTPVSKK